MDNKNILDDLRGFMDLWDKAEPEMNKNMPKQQPLMDFDTMFEPVSDKVNFNDLSPRELAHNIDQVFNENRRNIADSARKSANSPNPTQLTTLDADQELRVTPNFGDGYFLRELGDLRIKIEGLERKYHAACIREDKKEENSVKKEIETIRSKIEELSDSLTTKPLEDVE